MECLKVINPGLLTTIQDLGRFGYESQGVPTSGAMDEFAFRIANILVGNPEDTPGLEMTILGPTMEALNDIGISVTGAKMNPLVNGQRRSSWSSFLLKTGDTLSFTPAESGCRGYLAVRGGLKTDMVMGSVSTYIRGQLGGINGRQLGKEDVLIAGEKEGDVLGALKVAEELIPVYESEVEIRIILGPQDDYFSKETIDKLVNSTYVITKDSDRMGYRLEGPEIKPKDKYDIITDGLVPGAVQIPGNGKPIIMMKDAQTTGGYTKIAHVISADLQKLAQIKPGDKVMFKTVDISRAHKVLRENEELIRDISNTLKPIRYFNVAVNGESFDVSIENI